MGTPDIRLVTNPSDSPSLAGVTIFDFNPAVKRVPPGQWLIRDTLDFGAPKLLGDRDAVDALWGERDITFKVRIGGSKTYALGRQAAMARAMTNLVGGRGWLRVQLKPSTQPVWFRMYRPELGALVLENAAADGDADIWDIPVSLPVEPFAYGAEVTLLAAQTVNNDPTAATNPMRLVLPAVPGDAPTPLRVTFNSLPAPVTDHRFRISNVASLSQRLPIGLALATGLGPDTAPASVASAIGGACVSVSFTVAPGLANRVTSTLSSVPLGRYQVFVRAALDAETTTTQLQMSIGGATGALVPFVPNSRPFTPFVANGWTWVDLGAFTIPRSPLPASEPQNLSISPGFSLAAGRTSVAGTLRLDHLLLVPIGGHDVVESRTICPSWPAAAYLTGHKVVVDGESSSVFGYDGSAPYNAQTEVSGGAFVRGVPGQFNVLSIILHAQGGSGVSDDKALAQSVTVTCHPKLLYLGDS